MQNLLGILLLGPPQGWEWIIILVAILLMFGGKKIPELMKGIGKGIRGFKDGMKEIEDDIKSDDSSDK
jgi:sec-independent protein translocase protein TatA